MAVKDISTEYYNSSMLPHIYMNGRINDLMHYHKKELLVSLE